MELTILKESYEFMRMSARSPSEMQPAVSLRHVGERNAMRHHLLNDNTEAMRSTAAHTEQSVDRFPRKTPIGMAYVPVQQWGETFTAEEALCKGTLFPELNYPFGGGDCGYE